MSIQVEEEVELSLLRKAMHYLLPEEVAVETGLPMLLLLMHRPAPQETMIQEQLPAMRAELVGMVEVQGVSGEEQVVEVSLKTAKMGLLAIRVRLLGLVRVGPMECLEVY